MKSLLRLPIRVMLFALTTAAPFPLRADPVTPIAWRARWIAFPNDDSDKTPEPAPQFRTEFPLDPAHGKIAHATLAITGLGSYDCQINGQPVSNHALDPGWTNYNKTVLFNSFDVAPLLHPGDNAIAITLGNGPYNVLQIKGRYTKFHNSFGIPKTLAQLDIEFADGSHQQLTTGNGWKTARGPITFNHQYGGEDYDARRETPGWTQPHFDDKSWQPAAEVPAPGTPDHTATLMPAPQPPVIVFETFPAPKTTQPKPGVFVFDLGRNISGWPSIDVHGRAGATVRILPGELLDKNGLVSQRSSGGPVWYTYTLSGHDSPFDVESWQPRFSYYGFRYLQISGATPDSLATTQPDAATLVGVSAAWVHAALPPTGSFSSSDETLNQIHHLINNAILSNAQSILTDCPHREKLGWLEQSHLMAHAIMMNWDVSGLYTKIENDIADAQHPDGLIPDIAPEFVHFKDGFLDSPEWGSAGILGPLYAWQFYGNTQSLADHYPTMTRYADYLASKSKDNIIAYGLGDWYDIGPKPPGQAQLTSTALTCTATYYQDLRALQKIAEILNKPDDAKSFATRADAVQKSFNDKFFHPDTNLYESGSQTANAMPLALHLVPTGHEDAVLQNLVTSIRQNHNRISAGDVGFSYVVRALTDANQPDLLYNMATQSDGPGYVDQLRKGATTLTEAWDALPTSSQNHLMLGHIEAWFFEGLAGIQPDPASPGFKHFFLRPQFPKALTFVEASHATPSGQITSNWKRDGSGITCTLDIPRGTSATLIAFSKTEELAPGHYVRRFDINAPQP
ncbi:MAG TPA: family 78 glycoside hydrolase catalytic domain [Phycisphaerae bacterium]|nr:family 78 glycoside hydrolase catalytic domain [Phycisphaerae bacterium]